MTNSIETTPIEKKDGRVNNGGARANSGRKKGSKNHISVEDLLRTLEAKSGGQRYEDILVDDFLTARSGNDNNLILKYHNLILNKVMNNLAKIEVTDSEDTIAAKQIAFAEALSKLTGINTDIDDSSDIKDD